MEDSDFAAICKTLEIAHKQRERDFPKAAHTSAHSRERRHPAAWFGVPAKIFLFVQKIRACAPEVDYLDITKALASK